MTFFVCLFFTEGPVTAGRIFSWPDNLGNPAKGSKKAINIVLVMGIQSRIRSANLKTVRYLSKRDSK